MTRYRPTWVEVSSEAFAANVRAMKAWVGERVSLLAVLKADAYGHGAASLAGIALANGAAGIGVSSIEEGLALREAGIEGPILILGGVFPLENFRAAIAADLTPTVASLESAHFLSTVARESGKEVSYHLKVDTGMGRIGLSVPAAKKFLDWAAREKNIRLAGIYTHFAAADSDADFTSHQLSLFSDLRAYAGHLDFKKPVFHAANSAAILLNKNSHLDMVRPGIALYGASPVASTVKLAPVLSWHSAVVFLKRVPAGTSVSYGRTHVTKRETEIATLPVGYADGVPRAASNKAFVLVRGRRCPVIGRVTMDHIMIDVTGAGADVGDAAVLIGAQDKETITADEWAAWADTISYEILCGISKRVPRVTK